MNAHAPAPATAPVPVAPVPAPTTKMRLVSALTLAAMRQAEAEHASFAFQLQERAFSLPVRNRARELYLHAANRHMAMARLNGALAETLKVAAAEFEMTDDCGGLPV